ncbi:hypothetical protein DVH24_007911 [Malus domestica]|uniref:Uncharacterized protein n=1 Tax=Malus domestica TaxID=3750 RepID=A0A498JQ69_MALDO|nr:hypothetical protein DVH24_007911 [Malus domestica]
MDRLNHFAWGFISFEQLHHSHSFAISKIGTCRIEGDGEGDEDEEEEEVRETKKAHQSKWGCKGFSLFSG